jgi:hypothetical protein
MNKMALCLNQTKWNVAYLWVCCLCYKEKTSFVNNLKNLFTLDHKIANDLSFKVGILAFPLTTSFNTFDMQNCDHVHQFLTYKSIILHYHYQNIRTKLHGTKIAWVWYTNHLGHRWLCISFQGFPLEVFFVHSLLLVMVLTNMT